jgi:hypothetical protein
MGGACLAIVIEIDVLVEGQVSRSLDSMLTFQEGARGTAVCLENEIDGPFVRRKLAKLRGMIRYSISVYRDVDRVWNIYRMLIRW